MFLNFKKFVNRGTWCSGIHYYIVIKYIAGSIPPNAKNFNLITISNTLLQYWKYVKRQSLLFEKNTDCSPLVLELH